MALAVASEGGGGVCSVSVFLFLSVHSRRVTVQESVELFAFSGNSCQLKFAAAESTGAPDVRVDAVGAAFCQGDGLAARNGDNKQLLASGWA